ncbi:MAG: dihydrolipoyllysine-residue succinyltransferase [Verrucomicrobia bacterium]|nr:dihydrolipoyllysine-residue succinyltransferase [Verrucomicrobiota bacterium]
MSQEVRIPSVGESITSGTIAQWHKADGEMVRPGDLLLTVETDKISTEVPAEASGVLRIQVPAGTEVEIGAVVALIETGSDAATSAPAPVPVPPQPAQAAVAPPVAAPAPKVVEAFVQAVEPAERPQLTVLPPRPPAVAVPAVRSDSRIVRVKMSPLRRKIASHLVEAQHTAAILTTFNECDMSAIMKLRKDLQDSFVARHGIKLGFMSFFVKATVDALQNIPQVNGRIDGDDIIQNHFHDIGVAIGTEKGLIVPVIRDADQKTFAEIEQDIADYAAKARTGKIAFEDLQGGVFTISNGGIYGSLLSTPILNFPQSAILGMHAIQDRPVARDGQVVIRPMMNLALSYDHRLIDGKEAVTFLTRIKDCLEQPARLMVGA